MTDTRPDRHIAPDMRIYTPDTEHPAMRAFRMGIRFAAPPPPPGPVRKFLEKTAEIIDDAAQNVIKGIKGLWPKPAPPKLPEIAELPSPMMEIEVPTQIPMAAQSHAKGRRMRS